MKTILAISLIGYAVGALSQINEPLTAEHAARGIGLAPYLYVLEDPTADLTIAEVYQPDRNDTFQPVTGSPNYGFSKSAWWVRLAIVNNGDLDRELLIRQDYPLIDELDLWYQDPLSGTLQHHSGGDARPFEKRDIDHRDFLFSVVIPAQKSVTYYLRFASNGPVNVSLSAHSAASVLPTISKEQLAYGFYYGGFLVLVLYNLLMWLAVKDRAFLYYFLYVASYGAYFAVNNGLAFQFLWPNSPWLANQSLIVLLTLSLLFGLQFSRVFLRLHANAPRLDGVSKYLQFAIAALLLATPFLSYESVIQPLSLITIGVVVLILIPGTVTLFRGYWPALYFMLAWSALLAGVLAFMFKTFGWLPQNVLTEHGQQIGSLIEMILLSLALASRVNVLQRNSETDPLTLLNNRRFFDEKIVTEFDRARNTGQPLAMMMIDIDHFKTFNDLLGHAAGDKALKMVARLLKEASRKTDYVCRYGGEEFALILPTTEQTEAMSLADRFRRIVGAADIQGQQLTVSIGIASANDDIQSPAGLFEAADLALYKAKSQGRDCVVFFDAAFRESVSRRQS